MLMNSGSRIPELKGKGLFVFSDPGGAKPLLALAERHLDCIILSDRLYSFYNNFNVDVEICDSNIERIILKYNPHFIVTGTSYRSTIEKETHRLALLEGIPCFAFVDHWTSFRIRFEQADGSFLVPDQVWVVDERAKALALKAGIPEKKVVITYNPYYEWLGNWKPNINKETFLDYAGLSSSKQHLLLFAPDPLSNIDGKHIYGFDEIEVTYQLDILFSSNQINNWIILFKAHPNQNAEVLKKVLKGCRCIYLLPDGIETNTSLFYADAVMGFFSNILIEASILGKPVIRYLPFELENDPFAPLQIGIRTNQVQLAGHLRSLSKLV
jgi:hypothetical protein